MRYFLFVLYACGVVLGAFGAIHFVKKYRKISSENKLLLQNGQKVKAQFVDKRMVETRKMIHSSGRLLNRQEYFNTYQFDKKEGARGKLSFNKALRGEEQDIDLVGDWQEIEVPVSAKLYAEEGDVELLFLPTKPHINRILNQNGEFVKPNGLLMIAAFSVLLTLGSLFMFWRVLNFSD